MRALANDQAQTATAITPEHPAATAPDSPEQAPDEQTADAQAAAEATAPESPKAEPAKATGAKKPAVRLFGTVEIRSPLSTLPAWISVMERNKAHPIFIAGSKLHASLTWDALQAKVKGMPKLDQLRLVNSFWNRWPYHEDSELYKKSDYWATPFEFRKNSGDCEDYSITKYYTLRGLGFPAESMRIVVVMETIRNIAHAVLAVYLDDDVYILDNLSANVLSHSRLRNYVPRYWVNEDFRWVHLVPQKKAAAKKTVTAQKTKAAKRP
jgi:predicted transglutaminase-like cysteine proteinase